MSAHEQFADDLTLYALEVLQGDERVALEEHLEGCSSCRRELERLRGDVALLALSTAGPAPPQRARQRLMTAISNEPRSVPASVPPVRARRWNWGWVAAAAMFVIAAWFGIQSDRLAQRAANLQNELASQQAELQRTRDVVATLTAPEAQVVTVAEPNTPPQPQGKAIYVRDRASLVFIASNLPALPPQKAYELWLIPTQGNPIPAGVFKPDARGYATVIHPSLPAGVEAKAFAVTVEPEAGSSTPTLPIEMLGS